MAATSHKTDLTHIASVHDLDAEITRVKARNVMQQELLKMKMKQLPKEALKYGAIAIIPGLLAARITRKSYGAATGLLGWIFNRRKERKEAAREKAVKSAKQVGIFTGLSYLFAKLGKNL
ncbi:MAG TPA: hypothetical protein VF145_04015 [Chitinophagaceae bacterium]